MATLSIVSRILAYEDSGATNNPQQRPFDWSRRLEGISVSSPESLPKKIQALDTITVFNGTRTLAHDVTSEYDVTVSPLASNRYRLKWSGVGTAPAFRTARSVTLIPTPPSSTVTITPQLNQSVALTALAGSVFGAVQDGDVVFIRGVSTGDSAGPFDPLNEGYWSVLSASASTLILCRMAGDVYSATAETVTVTAESDVQIFSATGVQVDDILRLVSGFPAALCQNYGIVSVTADAVEFLSGTTLPSVSAVVPGASNVVVFSDARSYVSLETDQNIEVSINGGTAFTVEPILAGDPTKVGVFHLTGTVYSLSILNKSTVTASVRVMSVEYA
jgi:hypothetical protein